MVSPVLRQTFTFTTEKDNWTMVSTLAYLRVGALHQVTDESFPVFSFIVDSVEPIVTDVGFDPSRTSRSTPGNALCM